MTMKIIVHLRQNVVHENHFVINQLINVFQKMFLNPI